MFKKKVLVVEDNLAVLALIEQELRNKVNVLQCKTLEEGIDVLMDNQHSVDLIIVGCFLQGGSPTAMSLVAKIKKVGFRGDVLAHAEIPAHASAVADAGATYESTTEDVANLALKLLGA